MNDSELLRSVADAIRAASETAQDATIAPQTRFIEDLALDSLDIVAMLMRLEDHYRIKLDLDILPELRTVADLMAEIDRQRQAKSAA